MRRCGLVLNALAALALVACSHKAGDSAANEAFVLPENVIPLDLGQQPIVNPLNLWEMMIDGSPDYQTVGTVGTEKITTEQLDEANQQLFTRIGMHMYDARDEGWRWLLESEGLAREAARRGLDVPTLLARAYASLPAPPAGEIKGIEASKLVHEIPVGGRHQAAITLWRWHAWARMRSGLIARGLKGVRRERAQLFLVSPKFASPQTHVGIIGDHKITRQMLHLAAGYKEQTGRLDYFHAAENRFKAFTDDLLLQRAADAKHESQDALLAAEYAQLKKPSKADVAHWISEHPEYASVPERAADAVRTLREAAARDAFIARLADEAGGVTFLLKEPPIDRVPPDELAPFVAGNPKAAHTLAVMGCIGGPTCARGARLVVGISLDQPDAYRIELGDSFSTADPVQIRHAIALRCAAAQDRAWPMFVSLARAQTRGLTDELVARAKEAGADPRAMTACMEADRYLPQVYEDVRRGQVLGLQQNVLGVWFDGHRLEHLDTPAATEGEIRGVEATVQ